MIVAGRMIIKHKSHLKIFKFKMPQNQIKLLYTIVVCSYLLFQIKKPYCLRIIHVLPATSTERQKYISARKKHHLMYPPRPKLSVSEKSSNQLLLCSHKCLLKQLKPYFRQNKIFHLLLLIKVACPRKPKSLIQPLASYTPSSNTQERAIQILSYNLSKII